MFHSLIILQMRNLPETGHTIVSTYIGKRLEEQYDRQHFIKVHGALDQRIHDVRHGSNWKNNEDAGEIGLDELKTRNDQ